MKQQNTHSRYHLSSTVVSVQYASLKLVGWDPDWVILKIKAWKMVLVA